MGEINYSLNIICPFVSHQVWPFNLIEILNTYQKMSEICLFNLRQEFAEYQKFNKPFPGTFFSEINLNNDYQTSMFFINQPYIQQHSI